MTRRRAEPRCLAFAFAAWTALAHAQATVTPRLSLMQTWTDNLRLDDHNKDAALITTLSPGISIVSNSGAVRGSLDYALNGVLYTKTELPSQVTNSLAATGQAEVVPRTLYVDARAAISQQSVSAFGRQSTPTLGSQGSVANFANANQRETGTLAISPTLRGGIGNLADFTLRGDITRTEVRGTSLGDSRGTGASLNINQRNANVLSWFLLASTQQSKSSSSQSNRSSNVAAGLNYLPDPDLRFSVNAGQGRNDYLGGSAKSGVTGGATAQWTPTVRTQISADWQHQPESDSHTLRVVHRMSRSAWNFADTRTTVLGNTGAIGGLRTNYDQLFLLFTSQEPDPIKRDLLVRAELQRLGLSPDAPLAGGFLSSGPSQLRSQQVGVTLQGALSTLSAQFNRSITSRLGSNQNQGDLASSSHIEQRSYSLSASHRLGPQSGLSMTVSRQETSGDLESQSTRLTSVTANLTTSLGSRIAAQLGVRHSRFEAVTPYTENGTYANLTLSF